MGISALLHGTKHPTWANKTQVATYLMKVLFPPMLGPVIICRLDFPLIMLQQLLMQFAGSYTSIKGCLLSIRYIWDFPGGQMLGLT